MFFKNANYEKSNSIETIDFEPSADCVFVAQKILNEQSVERRGFLADAIIQDLCETARLPHCSVLIYNKPQRHRKNANGNLRLKVYGFYESRPPSIKIYNQTAIRKQVLAPKSFLLTLLHEFMHHYDTHKLKIRSIHTKGFYLRIQHLQSLIQKSKSKSMA